MEWQDTIPKVMAILIRNRSEDHKLCPLIIKIYLYLAKYRRQIKLIEKEIKLKAIINLTKVFTDRICVSIKLSYYTDATTGFITQLSYEFVYDINNSMINNYLT